MTELVQRYIEIDGYWVERRIFDYLYECEFQRRCSFECCSIGAWVEKEEVQRIRKIIKQIKPYLNKSKQMHLGKLKNKFVFNTSWGGQWKTRTWGSTCIFLRDNGECAIHRYCLDSNLDWIVFKFEICKTFPLIFDYNKKLIYLFGSDWETIFCMKLSVEEKQKRGLKPLIYSMKQIIVNKLGNGFWNALELKYHEFNKKEK